MKNTIECNFSSTCGDPENPTRSFLRKIKLIHPDGLTNLGLVEIAFTTMPNAIQQLITDRSAAGNKSPFFTIDSLSEHGIVLTDSGRPDENRAPSQYFFIPISQIACIHARPSSHSALPPHLSQIVDAAACTI